MSSRGGDETKQAFLEAGANLLASYNFKQLAAPITIDKLCKAVGLTHGAFYFHWPSKAAFDAEFPPFVTSINGEPGTAEELDYLWTTGVDTASATRGAAELREAALMNWDLVRADPMVQPQLLIAVLNDPEARAPLEDLYEGVVGTIIPLYTSWGHQLNIEPRPPFTWRSVAIACSALMDGFSVLTSSSFDPRDEGADSAESDDRSQPEVLRDLYADTMLAMAASMTRPKRSERCDDDDPARSSLNDFAGQVIAEWSALGADNIDDSNA